MCTSTLPRNSRCSSSCHSAADSGAGLSARNDRFGSIANGFQRWTRSYAHGLTHGATTVYARDDKHKDQLLKTVFKGKTKIDVGRFKGLGEMLPSQLKDTMSPKTRVLQKVTVKEDPAFAGNRNFRRNMFNIVLGMIGQLCLTILPMYVVLWLQWPLFITVALLLVIIWVLKKTWWDRLSEY